MFDDATVEYFDAQGLSMFSRMVRARVKRVSVAITSEEIELPQDCHQLLQILWRGVPLLPLTGDQSKGFIYTDALGRPRAYIYNELVMRGKVKLFPSPTSSELLVAGNIDTGVETSCILFYWQVCVGDNRLPQWFEQRLLRLYIQGRAYESEGKFNRPDASKYFLARYRIVETELVNLINKIAVLPRKKVVQGGEGTNFSRRSLRIPRLIGL